VLTGQQYGAPNERWQARMVKPEEGREGTRAEAGGVGTG
jgi:hypothetical protein